MSELGSSNAEPTPTVLVVEDTLEDALLMKQVLENELGYAVTLVQDGIRGCQLGRHQRWDLVITDLNLPGRSGGEVIRAVKNADPDTAVLAVTGYPEHPQAQVEDQGADEVIHKPLDREDFVGSVSAVRRGYRAKPESTDDQGSERRILAVGGLPGDIELGCGGILLGHTCYGHHLTLLVLTAGGDQGGAEDRKAEAERAADLLGADLILPEGFDSRIPLREEVNDWVNEAAVRSRPDVLYTPSPRDVRDSRMRIHRAAVVCDYEVPKHYSYQTATSTLDFSPTLFLDIERHMGTKLELLAQYDATPSFRPHLQRDIALASARYWGRFLGYGLAEPLEVLGASTI